tara:strand:+ start:587 stop:1108 length:522 start_codon:yes stop_codon:yes gene_type:complete
MKQISKKKRLVLDLDKTIWDCYDKNFQEIWAKQLVPPFSTNKDNSELIDDVGGICRLKQDFRFFITEVAKLNLKVCFLSIGARQFTPLRFQPSYIALQEFNLLKFFSGKNHLLYKTEKKIDFFNKNFISLFVDDSDENLKSVNELEYIKTIDAKLINSWANVIPQVKNFLVSN